MAAATTAKGLIGEAAVIADLVRQGHEVAIPLGHNLPFDLVVIRKEDGRLEKVQVKYTTGDGRVVKARIESNSAWVRHKYTADELDWVAVFDATSERCFYVHADLFDGHASIFLRLVPTSNGQEKSIRWANGYEELSDANPSRSANEPALPFTDMPE